MRMYSMVCCNSRFDRAGRGVDVPINVSTVICIACEAHLSAETRGARARARLRSSERRNPYAVERKTGIFARARGGGYVA